MLHVEQDLLIPGSCVAQTLVSMLYCVSVGLFSHALFYLNDGRYFQLEVSVPIDTNEHINVERS